MIRCIDVLASILGLIACAPLLCICCLLIWLRDFRSPIYVASRIGLGGRNFQMFKLRSMVVEAERIGGSSSGANDPRITPLGKVIRQSKLDELMQLWNVLRGDMSLVGPRPQVGWAVRDYTATERRLLSVRPGITDPSSIVFADQDDILTGTDDPDLLYNQIIRPWKSRLALLYVERGDFRSYCELIFTTVLGILSRRWALNRINHIIARLGADEELLRVARRDRPLYAAAPPGANAIVSHTDSRLGHQLL
ncbi:MAG: sugar transferase [Elusimicrobia bacterium]|nr:sugar transferase [Elusimicrobiota bacterium]